jgi:hypothetical protein
MFRLRFSRRRLARVTVPVVVALVLGLGVTVLPSVYASPATAADTGADCACAEVGRFSAPNPGVAPDYTLVTPDLATSPRGGYELEVTGKSPTRTAAIYRAGDRTRALLSIPLTGPDRRWGFSPDDNRFLTWTLGAGQLVSWQLYDLTGSAARLLRDVPNVAASSMNFAFSKGGQRLIVGAVMGNSEQDVSVYNAVTGALAFTSRSPISFPAYDPGAASQPGGPSAPRNVEVTVPKKTTDIDITWDEPLYQGDSPITGYDLQVVDLIPPATATLTEVGPRHLLLQGYTPGVKYTFELRIVNRAGKKGVPVTESVKIPLPKPAPVPTPTPTRPGLLPEESSPVPTETMSADPAPSPSTEPEPAPAPSMEPDPAATPPDDPGTDPKIAPEEDPQPVPDVEATRSPEPPPSDLGSADPADADPHASTSPAHAALALTARPAAAATALTEASDPVSTGGWGFSPDDAARYLVLTDTDGSRPRVTVYDLDAPAKAAFTLSITSPSAEWFFSPCAGAFGVLQLSPDRIGEFRLLDTATGAQLATVTREVKKSYGFTVEQVGERLLYYYWADGTGRMLTPVPDCGPPLPPPPTAPTDVSATAAIGRATVSWQHPATDIDSFEITPVRDGVAQPTITVDGRQRTAVLGTGTERLTSGSYRFRVTAIVDEQRSGESAPSTAANVRSGGTCEPAWTAGATEGSARGEATADGTRASFTYTVSGRTATFRTATGPASVLDAGWGGATSYPAGSATRVTSVTYPYWGDYLASVISTASDGAVSIATTVVHVAPKDPPKNDAFAKATPLTGTSGTFDAETRWSTCEPGEPGGEAARLTQWFTYRASADGALLIDDDASQVNGYLGNGLGSLQPIGERYTARSGSKLTVRVSNGEAIVLQVLGSAAVQDPGVYDGAWRFVTRPTNDDVGSAATVDPGTSTQLRGDLGAASLQTGEPNICTECGIVTAASVWYRWTADSDAYVWFHAATSEIDVELFAPKSGAPLGVEMYPSLRKVKQGDIGARQKPGQTYYVRVTWDETALVERSESTFVVDLKAAPDNDLVRDATAIRGLSGEIAGTNVGGYVEVIPKVGESEQTRSSMVWYEWTAPVTGPFSFTVAADRSKIRQPEALVFVPDETGGDPRLYAPTELVHPNYWRSPRTTFDAEEGERYLIAVTGLWTGGWTGPAEGDFVLQWNVPQAPGAPAGLRADVASDDGSIELHWSRPVDGGADVTSYRVTAEPALPEGSIVTVDSEEWTARIFGLTPGVAYELRVAAVNAAGVGAASAVTAERPADSVSLDPLRVTVQPGAELDGRLIAHGGAVPYTFALDAEPSWAHVDTATGKLSGVAPDEEGTTRFTATVTDSRGLGARREVTVEVDADREEPAPIEVQVPDASEAGWHDDDTTVVLVATDTDDAAPISAHASRGAALAAASSARVNWRLEGAQSDAGSGAGRAEVTITAEGETTLSYWADDPELLRTITIRIDRTAPTATIVSPAEGAEYPATAVPAPVYACEDPLSGIASCETVTAPLRALLGTAADDATTRQVAVRATDRAGNSVVVTRTYRVVDAATASQGERPGGSGTTSHPSHPALAGTGAQSGGAETFGILALLLGLGFVGVTVRRRRGEERLASR